MVGQGFSEAWMSRRAGMLATMMMGISQLKTSLNRPR